MAWRYAARYNSQRMAAMMESSSEDDEHEESDLDDGDISTSTAFSSEASTPETLYYGDQLDTTNASTTSSILKASMDVLTAELSSSLCSEQYCIEE